MPSVHGSACMTKMPPADRYDQETAIRYLNSYREQVTFWEEKYQALTDETESLENQLSQSKKEAHRHREALGEAEERVRLRGREVAALRIQLAETEQEDDESCIQPETELESRLDQYREWLGETEASLAACEATREKQALLIAKQARQISDLLRASTSAEQRNIASTMSWEDGKIDERQKNKILTPTMREYSHSRHQGDDEATPAKRWTLAQELDSLVIWEADETRGDATSSSSISSSSSHSRIKHRTLAQELDSLDVWEDDGIDDDATSTSMSSPPPRTPPQNSSNNVCHTSEMIVQADFCGRPHATAQPLAAVTGALRPVVVKSLTCSTRPRPQLSTSLTRTMAKGNISAGVRVRVQPSSSLALPAPKSELDSAADMRMMMITRPTMPTRGDSCWLSKRRKTTKERGMCHFCVLESLCLSQSCSLDAEDVFARLDLRISASDKPCFQTPQHK